MPELLIGELIPRTPPEVAKKVSFNTQVNTTETAKLN
jgi:hypothetical protein